MTASGLSRASAASIAARSREIALDKFGARIDRLATPFAQIIEDGDVVALIEQQLGANAADVTGTSDDQDFHGGKVGPPSAGCKRKCPTPRR